MMKKLLVLSLVLAIGAMSSAALVDDIKLEMREPGVVTVVGLTATNAYGNAGIGIYDAPGTVVGPFVKFDAAGDAGSISKWADFNGVDVFPLFTGVEGNQAVEAGDWFSFGYTGEVGDMFDIYDYAISDSAPVGRLAVIIPEPMTMGLLGLGALFLRRRK